MSEIEKELLKVTKQKPRGDKEELQEYLLRLVRAVSKLSDSAWEKIHPDAQEWANGAAEQIRAGDEADNFPDIEEAPEDIPAEELLATKPEVVEEVDEDGVVHEVGSHETGDSVDDTPQLNKKIPETKPKKEKSTKLASNGRVVSACHMIKKIVARSPAISVSDLQAELVAAGFKVTESTVMSLRSSTRDTLRVLNELKLGKFQL